jgi:hypothetical protein
LCTTTETETAFKILNFKLKVPTAIATIGDKINWMLTKYCRFCFRYIVQQEALVIKLIAFFVMCRFIIRQKMEYIYIYIYIYIYRNQCLRTCYVESNQIKVTFFRRWQLRVHNFCIKLCLLDLKS